MAGHGYTIRYRKIGGKIKNWFVLHAFENQNILILLFQTDRDYV